MTARSRRCTFAPICLLVLLLGLAISLPCRAAAGSRAQALCPLKLLGLVAGSLHVRSDLLAEAQALALEESPPTLDLASRTALRIHEEYVDPVHELRLQPAGVLELFGWERDGTARNVFRLFTKGSSVSDSTRIRCRPNWHGVVLTAIADF